MEREIGVYPDIAEKFKLNYVVIRNGTILNLIYYLNNNYQIIVNYNPPGIGGHFAVVKKISLNFIYLLDPHFGKFHKLTLKKFKTFWKGDKSLLDNEDGWFIALKKSRGFDNNKN